MTVHMCTVCGHVHDEDLEGNWDDLPDTFVCPECNAGKEHYEQLEL